MPTLRAYPIRLRQVLDNVVGNAIKYSHANGNVYISINSEEEQIILEVRDEGPGIPASDVPHIFDKFYRGTNISSTEGSGLGLATVKTIVESHQGRIWADSAAGAGTSFFIVLPIKSDTQPLRKPIKNLRSRLTEIF